MKKIFKSIIATLTLTMLLGTTCFAEEASVPQTYYNGMTIAETANQLILMEETTKAGKPVGTYNYAVYPADHAIVIVINQIVNGLPGVTISSYVYDDTNSLVTCTVTSVIGELHYSQSQVYNITVEVK